MAIPLPTDAVIDYLSITHRNIYRLPITPDQRCIIKKYLRLIENDIDENRGSPGPRSLLNYMYVGKLQRKPKISGICGVYLWFAVSREQSSP